jgi:hypothetical protein
VTTDYPSVEAEHVGDVFSESVIDDGLCAWIDILGTKSTDFSPQFVRRLLDLAAIMSSNKANLGPSDKYQFVSNARVNTVVIGDAICIAQKTISEPASHWRSSVPLVASFCSWSLFRAGLPHRGAIARGSLFSGNHMNTRYISGGAVIEAVREESKVKAVGLTVAKNLWEECAEWRPPATEDSFRFIDAFGLRFLTFQKQWVAWVEFCERNRTNHPYSAASYSAIKDAVIEP